MPTKNKHHNRQKMPNDPISPTAISYYQTHPAQKARLSVVATPIGNLNDLTERAIQILGSCDEIWAEDTRHTQALLSALGISGKRLTRVDHHSTPTEIKRLLSDLERRETHVALVSDAGTPGLCDPGATVLAQIAQFPNIKIEPIPGASAAMSLLSIAGVLESSFTFLGFFPRETKDREAVLKQIEQACVSRCFLFFESPHRIRSLLECLKEWVDQRQVTWGEDSVHFLVAKELTKVHESIWKGGGLTFLHDILHQSFDERGEWCLLLDLSKIDVKNEKPQEEWELTLECLILAGISVKEASQLIHGRFSVAKNLAYQSALNLQKKIKKNEAKA